VAPLLSLLAHTVSLSVRLLLLFNDSTNHTYISDAQNKTLKERKKDGPASCPSSSSHEKDPCAFREWAKIYSQSGSPPVSSSIEKTSLLFSVERRDPSSLKSTPFLPCRSFMIHTHTHTHTQREREREREREKGRQPILPFHIQIETMQPRTAFPPPFF